MQEERVFGVALPCPCRVAVEVAGRGPRLSHGERENGTERKERSWAGPGLVERKKEKEKTRFLGGFGNSPTKRRRLIKNRNSRILK